jgi:hypothetical protein
MFCCSCGKAFATNKGLSSHLSQKTGWGSNRHIPTYQSKEVPKKSESERAKRMAAAKELDKARRAEVARLKKEFK